MLVEIVSLYLPVTLLCTTSLILDSTLCVFKNIGSYIVNAYYLNSMMNRSSGVNKSLPSAIFSIAVLCLVKKRSKFMLLGVVHAEMKAIKDLIYSVRCRNLYWNDLSCIGISRLHLATKVLISVLQRKDVRRSIVECH